jgi:aryl-alcohol dehydrogenase
MNARAAVTRGYGEPFQVEHVAISASPGPGEALVRIHASGICHTDLIVRDGWHQVPLPVVLGHEGAGTVEDVGAGVDDVQPGDHVILAFPFCGLCRECLIGRPSNCVDQGDLTFRCRRDDGSSPFEGVHGPYGGQSSFSTHAIVSARQLVPIDAEVDLALAAPLGCGIATGAGAVLNTLEAEVGSSIAIFGLGAVGLAAVMAAAASGCGTIVAIDLLPGRLELAKDVGATAVVDASTESVVEAVKDFTAGGADYTVEAAGSPLATTQAFEALRGWGTCAATGNQPAGSEVTLSFETLAFNRGIRGCVLGNGVPRVFLPLLVELQRCGRLPVDKLVRTYPLDRINEAVADVLAGEVVKPVLQMI